jgi:hypothetical protein
VKRLRKIADQMQPELERDQPFARMVARVGKIDLDGEPLGFALFAAASRSGAYPTPIRPGSARSRCPVRSIRLFAALSDKRIRVDPTVDDAFRDCPFRLCGTSRSAVETDLFREKDRWFEPLFAPEACKPSVPPPGKEHTLTDGRQSRAIVDETGWGARFSQLIADGIVAEKLPAGMPASEHGLARSRREPATSGGAC